ncbi:hypothetical protein ST37_09600 [Vibrio sp. qd031]|nr:hypothetical protein ST37_09600 [Vibrio sp. qd031]
MSEVKMGKVLPKFGMRCKGMLLKKVILIDFDGVIRHWQSQTIETTEMGLGLPIGTLFSVAFSESLLLPTITGQQSHLKWIEKVGVELSNKFSLDIGAKLVLAWENAPAWIDYDFIEAIRLVSPRAKLVLVTNATDKLSQDIHESELRHSFDLIINSCQ